MEGHLDPRCSKPLVNVPASAGCRSHEAFYSHLVLFPLPLVCVLPSARSRLPSHSSSAQRPGSILEGRPTHLELKGDPMAGRYEPSQEETAPYANSCEGHTTQSTKRFHIPGHEGDENIGSGGGGRGEGGYSSSCRLHLTQRATKCAKTLQTFKSHFSQRSN